MIDNIEDDERELRQLRQAEHRRLLNDIEQARVESAEQSVVEGLRAKGLILSNECADDCHFGDHDAPAAPERGDDGVNRYLKSEIEHLLKENSTLIAQRERLLEVLQLIQGFNWQLDDSLHGQEIRRRAEEAITTSEQEGR